MQGNVVYIIDGALASTMQESSWQGIIVKCNNTIMYRGNGLLRFLVKWLPLVCRCSVKLRRKSASWL